MNSYFSGEGYLKWQAVIDRFHIDLPGFEKVNSPNYNNFLEPCFIVLHYTGGADAAGTINWFMDDESKVSAHFVIDRNGDITQCVSVNNIAWHCGASEWRGIKCLNQCSIGIELANWGPLRRDPENGMFYPYARNDRRYSLEQSQVVCKPLELNKSVYKYWEAYSPEQFFSLAVLIHIICSSYQITDLLSHAEIAPTRKIDPGPAFPLDIFKRFAQIARQSQ